MNKKRRFPWWLVILSAVIAAGAGTLIYFRAHPIQVKAQAIDLSKLYTTKVVVGTISTGDSTTGTVRTSQNMNVNWSASGQVAKVLVKTGDQVQKGQILAELDPASNITFETTQADLLTAQEKLASLQDTTASIATAKIALINAQAAVASTQKKLDDLNVTPTQAQIDTAYAAYLQDKKNVFRLQAAYNALADHPVTDLDRANALTGLNKAVLQENLDYASYNNLKNYQPNPNALADAKSALALAQSRLAVAQASYDAFMKGPDAATIASVQANITLLQSTLDQQYVRAPMDGVITAVSAQSDDLVNSGTLAFRIDNMSSLYIDLQVTDDVVNAMQVGQAVQFTFDAVLDQTFTGKVTDIGEVGAFSNGFADYTVTVVLQNPGSSVRPGMTAAAYIVLKQASDVLLVPNHSIVTQGSEKVIYVLADDQVSPVTVTVGLASDTQTEITSTNLQAGDLVVTNPTVLASKSTSTGVQSVFENLFRKLGVIV